MSEILLPLRRGSTTPIQALQNGQKSVAPKSTSGTNPDSVPRTRADPGRCAAGQAAGGLGGVSCQCQRRFLVCDLHRGDERRDVHRTARGPAAPSQEALDSDSRQLARPQGESGARLRRLDRWKVGIALPAWLRTGIEPGRIGMELYEENRDREAAARQGRISA